MMESCPHVEISAQKGGGTPVNSRKKNRKKGGIVLAVLLLLIAVAGFEVVQVYAQISDAQAQEQAPTDPPADLLHWDNSAPDAWHLSAALRRGAPPPPQFRRSSA